MSHPVQLRRILAACASLIASTSLPAQSSAPSDAPSPLRPDAVRLSPFLVSPVGDEGYRAANTLAGTRMNTSLFLTPASISVLTSEFLDDIGATRTEDFLRFSASTDYDVSAQDANGNGNQWYDAPAKIRGFAGATVTRDYFPWSLSSDTFNVERVDVNRGPNAVLYGIGAPGGVINTSTKRAALNARRSSTTVLLGSWGRRRAELDVAVPLVRDRLALRLNSVLEDRNGWRDFEEFHQRGFAVAGTYAPFPTTAVRVGVEKVRRDQLVPHGTPDDAGGTRWLAAGAPLAPNPLNGTNPDAALLGFRTSENVYFAPQLRAQPFRLSTIGADARPDLAGTQAPGFWDTVPGPRTLAQGNVDDPYLGSLVPLQASLPGPGSTTNNHYTVYHAFLEQQVAGFTVELGFRRRNYWRDNRTTGVGGVLADPNPVLPGTHFADGDSRLAAGRLPGTALPDVAAPNPMVGRLYVEGQAQTRPFDENADQYRVALGREFDLTRRHRWLGRHAVSALWQLERNRNGTWVEREYNLTPANGQPIDSVTNNLIRRTYLDFSRSGGTRGAMDPWTNPIRAPGVTSGFAFNAPNGWRRVDTGSRMLAGQSRFLADRLAFTAGWRRDRVDDYRTVAGAVRIPNSTNLYSKLEDVFGPPEVFAGNTSTFGVFASPLRWLGLTYNQSNSVLPQTAPNPFGQLYGPRRGEGRDYGVRLNLADDRLYLTATRYTTDDRNSRTGAFVQQQTGFTPVINAVIDTLLARNQPLPPSMVAAGVRTWSGGNGMTVDVEGRGQELELVGRLARGWSISLNASETKLKLGNVAPFQNAFFVETRPLWDGNATPLADTPTAVQTYVRTRDNTPGRDFTLNPATINDAYDYASLLRDEINRADGQQPLQHTEHGVNVFTSYRFAAGAARWLRGCRIGGGANWRSAPVIGYDAARGDAPIRGDTTLLVNAMLGRIIPLAHGLSCDVQLNVQNLLGEQDMIPFSATAPGQVIVYNYPRVRRSFDVRANFRF